MTNGSILQPPTSVSFIESSAATPISLKAVPAIVNNKVQYSNSMAKASIGAFDIITPEKEPVTTSKPFMNS